MDREQWDERYTGPELVWTGEPNRWVVEELAGLRPARALDLGTGEGRNAIWLAERGWRVTAVDFSAVGLAKAARLAASRHATVDWVEADVRDYEPEPGGYDLVLVAYLHLAQAELAQVFRRASAALASGGTLLVVGHDRDNITRGYGGPQDPGILHTHQAVAAALPGLNIRRAEQARRPVATDQGEKIAIDTVVRAERP